MRWILDDGPLDYLASLADLSKLVSYPAGRLCVAPATAAAARQSESRSRLLSTPAADGGAIFHRFEIFLSDDDPAAELLLRLRGEEHTPVNLAECEAIAWAAVHAEDAVFVTQDKTPAYTALAVLGRAQVAHPFDLWLDLLDDGVVTTAEFEHLCERTRRKERHAALRRLPGRVTRRCSTGPGGEQ